MLYSMNHMSFACSHVEQSIKGDHQKRTYAIIMLPNPFPERTEQT